MLGGEESTGGLDFRDDKSSCMVPLKVELLKVELLARFWRPWVPLH